MELSNAQWALIEALKTYGEIRKLFATPWEFVDPAGPRIVYATFKSLRNRASIIQFHRKEGDIAYARLSPTFEASIIPSARLTGWHVEILAHMAVGRRILQSTGGRYWLIGDYQEPKEVHGATFTKLLKDGFIEHVAGNTFIQRGMELPFYTRTEKRYPNESTL